VTVADCGGRRQAMVADKWRAGQTVVAVVAVGCSN